ncbi:hypothetical protein GOARA_027_00460 [Gordonia araii NBRC 100433]|uniref:Uncharacterized protein n=1 Tax=Gordonia araii NBRC 100433 TaxID=1073574 RepID=G7GZQ8_9ACTN|nr:hypothetical protein [Gordonia araii]NNG98855.1 hypothetical protein [Gordonia araii NBRC 100433]GAB09083.1 hypothetical protein GOARA_027_00460 [Gordonia araii NBRC 100433]
MQKFKRIAAATLAAATVATGATAIAAAPAEAKIRSGNYWYSAYASGDRIARTPARVVGNRFYPDVRYPRQVHRIHPTPRGGYYVAEGVSRTDLRRVGAGYAGPSYWIFLRGNPATTSYVRLTPR